MSYRLKLTVTISLLIAITFSLGGTLILSTSFRSALDQETQTALTSFETIQNTLFILNSLSEQTGYDSLSHALAQMESQKFGNWQALSLKVKDTILFQSGNTALLAQTLSPPPQGNCSHLTVSDDYGEGILIKSIITAGDDGLELYARFDLSAVYNLRRAQQKQFITIYMIVVMLGVIAAAVLSFALTKPLHRLAAIARKISDGNLSVRSKITVNDEFGQLSSDFDHMADKLQQTISRLESDMQQQESFMGAFAHELKTPMTSIIGFADLLRQGNLDENTRIMAASYIYSEGRRLERLSFKLLELIMLQKDSITPKHIQLTAFLYEIEQALSPTLKGKGIQLVCKADPETAFFEPDLVKSLLYNLVDNASKAMSSQGVIGIRASAISGGCQFQVADNGRGMEQAELSKITEAFYRVDKARARSQGGAGIGLALCKQIAELHNGNIVFASEPGKGTRVTVTLYQKGGETDG